MPHIAVLGAGITGITTAAKLQAKGFEVTVIDRQPYPAMETSFANGGQLSASNAEVWNSWATVFKGIKWLARKDAPLSMSPFPSWHKISWLAEFIAAIPRHRANTLETVRLALMAREHLIGMADQAQIDFDLEKRGILHIYSDAAEFEAGRRSTKLLAQGGLERQEVSPDEARALEPTLPKNILGGFYTESDFTGDIHKFTTHLAKYIERQGAHLQLSTNIDAVKAQDDGVSLTLTCDGAAQVQRFDAAVVAAGVGSRNLASQFGDRVNVYPVKGYSITVNMDEASQAHAPWVSLLDEKAKIVTSRLGPDRFRIAGTAEFNGTNYDIRADRVKPLVDWCRATFPDVSTEHVTPWAGLRPMMPNMLPRLGAGKNQNVFYNTGHGHLGWTLSAATAEIVATDVEARFRPARATAPLGGVRTV